MEYIRVVIVLFSVIVIQTTINAEKDERDQTVNTAVVQEFIMGKTTWGPFGDPIFCEQGSRVSGFRLRVQPKQGILWDDSALNGVQLACTNGNVTEQILGVYGTWKEWVYCGGKLQRDSSKFAVGFNFRSESQQGIFADDTAGNNVKLQCNDGSELDGGGQAWGTWHSEMYTKCALDFYLCGVQSRIEPYQKAGDNTGMNQIKFLCCGKELDNLAIGKVAEQSTTWKAYKAENAIDGNLKTYSWTNTAIAWWRLDLGKPALIYKVRVYPWGDYFEPVATTTVYIGNSNATDVTCGTLTEGGGQERRERNMAYDISCEKAFVGRYIILNKNSDNDYWLAMEEVEVYGRYI